MVARTGVAWAGAVLPWGTNTAYEREGVVSISKCERVSQLNSPSAAHRSDEAEAAQLRARIRKAVYRFYKPLPDDFTRDRVGQTVERSPLRENSFSNDD